MKTGQILFSAPMILALKAGTKTQTRRLARPRWGSGDMLVVREAYRLHHCYDDLPPRAWVEAGRSLESVGGRVHYEADGKAPPEFGKLRPSIHMPSRASRLTLRVTEVRTQRLRDIGAQDALDEGITVQGQPDPDGRRHFGVDGLPVDEPTPERAYFALWNHINGAGAAEADPLVWITTFQVDRRPVADILRSA